MPAPDTEARAFEALPLPPVPEAPRLSRAAGVVLHWIDAFDESGACERLAIPAERPLTVFVDKREIVTLMTLGAAPELLVLGWLLNQRLVTSVDEVEAITVDWDVGAAAVKTRQGISGIEERTARRTVTTGCGQGTVFGDAMSAVDRLVLRGGPVLQPATLLAMLDRMRHRASVHRAAGSVHGCALFDGEQMLVACEDVGRHNAIDTIAGWMATRGIEGEGKIFYTTGRLTSEMVIKAAQMGVALVVSRNGVTAMGHELGTKLGMTLVGRAANRRFLCYCGAQRIATAAPPVVPA